MKAYPSSDGVYVYDLTMSLAYKSKTFVDCRNSDVYNSQLITKIKSKKNDIQLRLAQT